MCTAERDSTGRNAPCGSVVLIGPYESVPEHKGCSMGHRNLLDYLHLIWQIHNLSTHPSTLNLFNMIKTLVSVSVGLSLAKMMFLVLLHPNRAYAQSAGIQACLEEAVSKDASRARFPSEPDYASKHVRPYNLNFQHTPAAVMYPNSSTEVAAIVNCASKNHVRVQARGGGHDLTNKGMF